MSPASFIFFAVSLSTSNIVGIVHANSFASRPLEITLSKSSWPKKPSSGLKIPSEIFSTSFAKPSVIVIENNPDGSFFVKRFTSLPPCGFIPTMLSAIISNHCYPCEGHILFVPLTPTTSDRLSGLHRL